MKAMRFLAHSMLFACSSLAVFLLVGALAKHAPILFFLLVFAAFGWFAFYMVSLLEEKTRKINHRN